MLSVQLSIIKLAFRDPCVVKARFVPWTKQIKLKMRHYGNKSVKVLLFTAPFLISVLLGSEWVLGS